jgi:hypothetical protein
MDGKPAMERDRDPLSLWNPPRPVEKPRHAHN